MFETGGGGGKRKFLFVSMRQYMSNFYFATNPSEKHANFMSLSFLKRCPCHTRFQTLNNKLFFKEFLRVIRDLDSTGAVLEYFARVDAVPWALGRA